MKKIILTLAVFIITFNISSSQDNEVIKTIKNRKSVRHFTGESVSKDDLKKILESAMNAPTAVNKQPWSFVVATDRKILDALADSLPYAKMLAKAGAVIIVCAIPEKAHDGKTEFAIIDCSLAGENILLTVESLGLGAVWTAAYPYNERMNAVRNVLGIPQNIIPLNVIPIGHPTGEDKPKDKFNEENIHWEKW
ncbi:MAG: nitroreductase family protein [Ignavibacteria bacterium]|jgi:nitroreductase